MQVPSPLHAFSFHDFILRPDCSQREPSAEVCGEEGGGKAKTKKEQLFSAKPLSGSSLTAVLCGAETHIQQRACGNLSPIGGSCEDRDLSDFQVEERKETLFSLLWLKGMPFLIN